MLFFDIFEKYVLKSLTIVGEPNHQQHTLKGSMQDVIARFNILCHFKKSLKLQVSETKLSAIPSHWGTCAPKILKLHHAQ